MAAEFSSCVEQGLRLAKRIYYGKGSAPEVQPTEMSRSAEEYLPTAPMVYAVIQEPAIVDNPDIPSYQPYVHGRCEPPALIPLHMHGISMEIDCHLDTAFVTVTGSWRLHCVMSGKSCDCLVAVPTGEQGSLLGVEIDVSGRSYRSELIAVEETKDIEKVVKAEDVRLLNGRIYTAKIPKVHGGSTISIKICWSQKLSYLGGQFCLSIPYNFPAYVAPVGKKISKREKILLHVNSGIEAEVLCGSTSHPLKELKRQVGKLSFSYEAEVSAWSRADFNFSCRVSSAGLFGSVLLQSPSLHDIDQREMFCFYAFPGQKKSWKAFRKEVVFLIDVSGSMHGTPLEKTKNSLFAALSELTLQDTFNIIAFNEDTNLFSPSMEQATKEAISKATLWMNINCTANGATNIRLPLEKAMKLLAETGDSIPFIFLITDGTVEDESEICKAMQTYVKSGGTISPRVCTFGIGKYCNHYFLQMLAQIGRGLYDAAYDEDSIDARLQRLFTTALSVVLANITLDPLEHLDSLELFPTQIPDLSCGSPLIVSGRYKGSFPETFKVKGMLADMSKFEVELKSQTAKDLPLDRVLARRQINQITSHAWLLGSTELEEKVIRMSKQSGVPSEYTSMILVVSSEGKKAPQSDLIREVTRKLSMSKKVEWNGQEIVFLGSLGVGFGNLKATVENLPPGTELKPADRAEELIKAASNCCGRVADRVCCLCFIKACSYLNNQCVLAFTQLCTALACCECLSCCFDLCSCLG